jgi:AraC-like DNA-binding protein
MKPIYEQLVPKMVACQRVKGKNFGCQWHFHPEMELTLVLSGGTQRWIGDNMSPLREGDLTFLGSNLPHDFRNDPAPGAPFREVNAVNVHFHPEFLGTNWLQWAEMNNIQRLFQQAAHGLHITGRSRELVSQIMLKMLRTQGIKRLILLMEILQELSTSRSLVRIASPGFFPELQVSDQERMGMITSYIHEHIEDPLYLTDVARHVGMSEGTFSRFFRSLTRKTFPAYLNELRVARVCRLLTETDATVTEIAMSCGFDSMANFQSQFRRQHGCSPKIYRQRAMSITPMAPGNLSEAS